MLVALSIAYDVIEGWWNALEVTGIVETLGHSGVNLCFSTVSRVLSYSNKNLPGNAVQRDENMFQKGMRAFSLQSSS